METYRNTSSQSKPSRSLVIGCIGAAAVLLFLWAVLRPVEVPTVHKQAVVVLSGDSSVSGTVTFEQASKSGPVTVIGDLRGLDASAERGFHIHQLGDATNGCISAGPHFNPHGKNHGAPTDSERHAGDLGNIESDRSGVAKFTIKDEQITLNGPLSLIGRTVVLHAGTDDLGKGNNEESLKTGNAGGRAACGVIGIAQVA
ncbi:hypothetical protein EWM64_g7970 [Hericium alpestre]|uniref:Superoxide dismutase [Cu-Zn] n=1 Tax=Hericium alpestre TaxID=135208 RepID=A0A4Y9ZMM1_9AGAM|nr:hypothetical protein EWM64_g7970 [Hericium alpestre]